MKKSILSLGGVAVLSSEEQKKVKGGICQFLSNGVAYYITFDQVDDAMAQGAEHYCCASCGTASWSHK